MKTNNSVAWWTLALLIAIAYMTKIECGGSNDQLPQLNSIQRKYDSLESSMHTRDSAMNASVDSLFSIISDLNTRKAQSEANTITLKQRIDQVVNARKEYLNSIK